MKKALSLLLLLLSLAMYGRAEEYWGTAVATSSTTQAINLTMVAGTTNCEGCQTTITFYFRGQATGAFWDLGSMATPETPGMYRISTSSPDWTSPVAITYVPGMKLFFKGSDARVSITYILTISRP